MAAATDADPLPGGSPALLVLALTLAAAVLLSVRWSRQR